MTQVEVLNLLRKEKRPMSTPEIAEKLNYPRYKAHAFLRRLKKWGLVESKDVKVEKGRMKVWWFSEMENHE